MADQRNLTQTDFMKRQFIEQIGPGCKIFKNIINMGLVFKSKEMKDK
jgi:hypothetical protein